MTETNLMSYNTFTFKTEAQMLLHIRLWEEKGKLLFAKLKQKGCTRFCYNQIWNKKGTYKTSTLFEYNSPQAYKDCQKAIDSFRQSIMKELEAISPVIESSRNVILQDLYWVEIIYLSNFVQKSYVSFSKSSQKDPTYLNRKIFNFL